MTWDKKTVAQFSLTIIAAWLVFGLVRFFVIQPEYTHYHADFAVYINGEREQFDNFAFYEEVTQCSVNGADATPESRVHLHDNVNSIVHVHDELVTWSHFFSAIDWGLTDFSLTTWDEVYSQNDNEIHFVLNGESVDTFANKVIGDQDIAVIAYGGSEQDAVESFNALSSDSQSAQFNLEQDPAACSGEEDSLATRMQRAWLFAN